MLLFLHHIFLFEHVQTDIIKVWVSTTVDSWCLASNPRCQEVDKAFLDLAQCHI